MLRMLGECWTGVCDRIWSLCNWVSRVCECDPGIWKIVLQYREDWRWSSFADHRGKGTSQTDTRVCVCVCVCVCVGVDVCLCVCVCVCNYSTEPDRKEHTHTHTHTYTHRHNADRKWAFIKVQERWNWLILQRGIEIWCICCPKHLYGSLLER